MRVLTVILSLLSFSQNIIIENEHQFFQTNSFKNIFLIDNFSINQYNFDGKKIQSYSNNEHGNISSIDASNPLRILVFYKDFNQIVFLDNKLSEITSFIKLNDQNITEINAICASTDGAFWLFNENTSQLEKYNQKLELIFSGTNMQSIIDRNTSPSFLRDTGKNIYLGIKNKGVYVFDIFGAFIKFIPLEFKNNLKIINNYIFYDSDSIYSYNTINFEKKALKIDLTGHKNFDIEQNIIFLSNNKNIIKIEN